MADSLNPSPIPFDVIYTGKIRYLQQKRTLFVTEKNVTILGNDVAITL